MIFVQEKAPVCYLSILELDRFSPNGKIVGMIAIPISEDAETVV